MLDKGFCGMLSKKMLDGGGIQALEKRVDYSILAVRKVQPCKVFGQ